MQADAAVPEGGVPKLVQEKEYKGGIVDLYEQGLANEQEESLLQDFRRELRTELDQVPQSFAEMVGDINLLRFLRGNDHDIAESSRKFRAMLQWRAKHGADAVRQELAAGAEDRLGGTLYPEGAVDTADSKGDAIFYDLTRLPHADKVLRHYPERLFHGVDKHGNPVMITQNTFIHRIDALMRNVTAEEYMTFRVARGENRAMLLQRLSARKGRMVKMVFVWDLQGMSLGYFQKLLSPQCVKYRGGYDEDTRDCYPEICYKIVCVNVPWFLQVLWTAARKFMNKQTLSKISVSGDSFDALHELVDPSELPVSLGGTCVDAAGSTTANTTAADADAGGAAAAAAGSSAVDPIVRAVWARASAPTGDDADDDTDALPERAVVGARGSHDVTVDVDTAGSVVVWEFRPVEHDISVSVTFSAAATGDGEGEGEGEGAAAAAVATVADAVVKPATRHDHTTLERGSFEAPGPGTLKVTFDNSYSFFRSKTVMYAVSVASGEEAS